MRSSKEMRALKSCYVIWLRRLQNRGWRSWDIQRRRVALKTSFIILLRRLQSLFCILCLDWLRKIAPAHPSFHEETKPTALLILGIASYICGCIIFLQKIEPRDPIIQECYPLILPSLPKAGFPYASLNTDSIRRASCLISRVLYGIKCNLSSLLCWMHWT